MFLQIMNLEEKEKFLELVFKIANIDGVYADEEQEIIESYKKELELKNIKDTDNVSGLITFFAEKNEVMRKIVLFETIGLVNADDKLEREELELLEEMKEKFILSEKTTNKIDEVAKKLQSVYDEIYTVLFD